ncbi:hypothetical protein FVB9532_01583 [Mesonia oceanica]|uniref:Uncharacterized protein n=1 Tax=Mesonia oceanica TaxID=2687242 RepID=A0AC61Y723_9FLAO|nr:hypothetical protein FVB9532_01583 [Mesonia oceanica]
MKILINLIKNPSKNILILFTAIWLLIITLFIFSITDVFDESLFQKKYIVLYLLVLLNPTLLLMNIFKNYRKNKKSR